MVQRRDLNAPPGRRLADAIRAAREAALSSKTGAAGVTDLGEHGDTTWRDPVTGEPSSVRELPPRVDATQEAIDDAKVELEAAQEAIDGAKADLDAERAAREAALEAAEATLAELDQRLEGVDGDSGALEALRSDLAAARDEVEAAQAAADAAAGVAATANDNALAAAGIAADKGRIIYAPDAPTAPEDQSTSNLWIDSDDGRVYVWDETAGAWIESENESLRDAAQAAAAALAAAEAADAKASDAAGAAAAAQAAAEAAQRTADDATLDAREAHNEAVATQARVGELTDSLVNLAPWGGLTREGIGSSSERGHAGWVQVIDPEAAPHGYSAFLETTVSDSQGGWTAGQTGSDLESIPVEGGRTYRLTYHLWTDAPSDNLAVGFFPTWLLSDGTGHNGDWGGTHRADYRAEAPAPGEGPSARGLWVDPFESGEWRRIVELIDAPFANGLPATEWRPRFHRWQAGSAAYGGDGSSAPGEVWRIAGIRVEDVTDLLAAEAAAAEAQQRADEAIAEAGKATTAASQAADNAVTAAQAAADAYDAAEAAEASSSAATGAAGVAEAAADRAAADARDALAQVQAAGDDVAAAQAAVTAAEAAADEAERQAREAGTAAANADAAAARAAADAAQAALDALEAAREEIRGEIRASANGKNAITVSASPPSASQPGVVAGDTWWRIDGDGVVFGQWTWTGSKWAAREVRSEVIANLDVSKLVVHDELEVVGDAVIGKLWADGIAARSVEASRLTVASGNIFPDTELREGYGWNTDRYSSTGGYSGGGSILIESGTSQRGSYHLLSQRNLAPRIEAGRSYAFGAWMRPSGDFSSRGPTLYVRLYKESGDWSFASPGTYYFPAGKRNVWQHGEFEFEVPAPGEGEEPFTRVIIGFYVNNGFTGSARFSDPTIRPLTGSVLIADGAVGADKIIADEVAAEVSHLVKARVENLTVTDGATIDDAVILKLASEMITAGVLRTGETGQRVVIDESGIVMYGVDPDGAEFELVRIGPSGDNLITAGETTISPAGVQAPAGAFESLSIDGRELTEHLDDRPRGLVAWGRLTQNSSFDSDTSLRARRAELQTFIEPGRAYRVRLSTHFLDTSASAANVREYLHYSLDGASIPRGSIAGRANVFTGTWARHRVTGSPLSVVPGMEFGLTTPSDFPEGTRLWVMYSTQAESSNGPVRVVASSDYPLELSVEDLGTNISRDMKRWNDNNEGSANDTTPPTTRRTSTWGAGGFGGDTSAGDVVQGYYSGVGMRSGGWVFSSSMRSALSGSTIEKFEVYLYASHWYWGSGGTAVIRPNNGSYKGTTFGSTSHNSAKWPRNSGRWVTLPSSWYGHIASGTYRGVSVETTSTNSLYYGRFRGSAAKFRATYRK